jgi:soluble lytic murein transglycosylase-like protein
MKKSLFSGFAILALFLSVGATFRSPVVPVPAPPAPPKSFYDELQLRENAPLEVALVFGRAKGCAHAKPELIKLVAREAVSAGVPANVLAATVAVESECYPLAVSSRGALGLTQVMPKVWSDSFDFTQKFNLFNPSDNVYVGARIMATLIRQHGLTRGVQLYNGAGVGCPTCDAGYSSTILRLCRK